MFSTLDSLADVERNGPFLLGQSGPQLLVDAQFGSPEAFELLYGTHRKKLFGTAVRITRNHEDAEDALQDSLMKAFVHLKEFRGQSSVATWLTRIVINSALMIRRKNRNKREVSAIEVHPDGDVWLSDEIADESLNPEQRLMQSERSRILRKAVGGLRPTLRAVVEIGHLQERSWDETARALDISVAAAKGRFFHSRVGLRRSRKLRAIAGTKTGTAV
jgi:RNA polymerase sigma-70 factor (ECF subfamily)